MNKKNHAVVISNPVPAHNLSPFVSLQKFLKMASELYNEIDVLVANAPKADCAENVSFAKIKCARTGSKIKRVLSFVLAEVKYFFKTLATVKKGDDVYFWIGDKMLSAFSASKLKGANVYYFLMGNPQLEKQNGAYFRMAKYMAENANAVCVESPAVAEQWQLEPKKVLTIHLYQPLPETAEKSDDLKIGILGRLTKGKHVLESISAFEALCKDGIDAKLEIIGDGPLKEDCESRVAVSEFKEKITLFGWKNHDEVYDIISDWRFLLLASDTEGLPNSLLEAMAYKIIPIVTPVGGIKDIVVNGENGFVLNGTDEESIYNGIITAIDYENESLVRKNARKTVEDKFSFDESVRNFALQIGA